MLRCLAVIVAALVWSLGAATACFASARSAPVFSDNFALARSEPRFWSSIRFGSELAAVSRAALRARCEDTRLPEALATPDPLLEQPGPASRITVSFIIGTDGRVHNPLILEGSNLGEIRLVLEALRSWRYRPALCNGVPTDAEGKIAFSSRQQDAHRIE